MSKALYAGIDAGSSATKCVVLDAGGEFLGHHVVSSRFDYAAASDEALNGATSQAGYERRDIDYCISTGYGRDQASAAQRNMTEITCHARGARQWYPQVRHVIDIGGQDTKIIRLHSNGKMAEYRMNAKCAAGTGTFLESIARKLGVQSTFAFTSMRGALDPLLKSASELPLDIYMEWGTYDLRSPQEAWDLAKTNREMAEGFRSRGYSLQGGEVRDGTGWSSWRNRTDVLFETLFPLKGAKPGT